MIVIALLYVHIENVTHEDDEIENNNLLLKYIAVGGLSVKISKSGMHKKYIKGI